MITIAADTPPTAPGTLMTDADPVAYREAAGPDSTA